MHGGLLSGYVGWEGQEKDGVDDGRERRCIHELLRRRRQKNEEGQEKEEGGKLAREAKMERFFWRTKVRSGRQINWED
jgi:hypothetical protein